MKQFNSFNLNGHLGGQSTRTRDQFNRQLQGFTVFTGTAHWYTGVKYQPDSIPFYVEQGRRARSKAITGAVAHLRESVISRFRIALAEMVERHRTRLAVKELSPLSARMLEDIGITRHDIASLAAGTLTVGQINTRRQMLKSPGIRLVPGRALGHSRVKKANAPAEQHVMDRAA